MLNKSHIRLTAFLVIGVVLFLTALLGFELQKSYLREIENAEISTASIAKIIEKELLSSIGKIDLIAQEAQYSYEKYLNAEGVTAEQLNPTLKRLLGRVPGVLSLRLIDNNGNYVFDATGKPSTANIADRRYFRVHQSGELGVGANRLFGEGPLFSRVANIWAYTFSRRVLDRDGNFRGIVQSSIPNDWLGSSFSSLSAGISDSAALNRPGN